MRCPRSYSALTIAALAVVLVVAAVGVGLAQVTYHYGVYLSDTSGISGSTNFNLFSAGTSAVSVFEGKVGVGTTTPSNRLHVATGPGQFTMRLDAPSGEVTGMELYLGTLQKGVVCVAGGTNKCLGAGEGADDFIVQSDGALSLWTGGIASSNRRLTILSGGNVGIGTSSPSYNLEVNGSFAASSKSFRIAHPLDPAGKHLVHGTLEGPEHGVYYRGEMRLSDGSAVVTLPPYFEALTRKGERTVQLTPIDGWAPLYVVGGVEDGRFTVRGDGDPAQRFYWEVRAVRADVARLVVEEAK